jgi:hypothetical protein
MTQSNNFTLSSTTLKSLLSDISAGIIRIPEFQRLFTWTSDDIIGFIDSIYRGSPTGSFLFWISKELLSHRDDIGGFSLPKPPKDQAINYILDGQQRIATLHGVFQPGGNTANNESVDRFDICFIPEDEQLVHINDAGSKKSILLRDIFANSKDRPSRSKFSDDEWLKIEAAHERFSNYEFSVTSVQASAFLTDSNIFEQLEASAPSIDLSYVSEQEGEDKGTTKSNTSKILAGKSHKSRDDNDLQRRVMIVAIAEDILKEEPLIGSAELCARTFVELATQLKPLRSIHGHPISPRKQSYTEKILKGCGLIE